MKILALLIIILFRTFLYSQETCINADFENGNLDNWITSGIAELVSGGNDYYGNFPVSAPGGMYSLKLGNSTIFPQPESTAKKSFIVSNDYPYILYQFALVNLGYPHDTEIAARSSFKILNNENTEIPCTFYEVFAADGGPQGFEFSSRPPESNFGAECCYEISFLKWNSILVDLRAYIGQLVTIELKNSWCLYGPDWAYSYFDAQCTNLEILQNCSSNDTIKLKAPNAAISYLWSNGDTTQTINVTDIEIGQSFSCTFTYDGINDSCEDITIYSEKKIIPKYINSIFAFDKEYYCEDEEIKILNYSTVQTYNTIDSINYTLIDTFPESSIWFYNNQTSTLLNPILVYNESGNKQVQLISTYQECKDTNILSIPIYPNLLNPIIESTEAFCVGDEINLVVENIGNYNISWSGPNNFSSNSNHNVLNLYLENIGTYQVYIDNDTCRSELVSIFLIPENPYSFENINIPNIITCNNDFVNDEFIIIDEISSCYDYTINFYNRWGEIVYIQTNYNEPFKGYDLKNKKLNCGVYYYNINYQSGTKSGFLHVEY